MSLCPYTYLRVSLSGFLTASGQGSLTTIGELLNISALDPLLPTFLIATLCLCALSVITYYSLVIVWEVFWASRRSPSLLDPSAEVVLTVATLVLEMEMEVFKLREQVMQMRCSLILPSLDCIPDFKLLCILHVNAMLQAPAWITQCWKTPKSNPPLLHSPQ